jgi:hypothetical protein
MFALARQLSDVLPIVAPNLDRENLVWVRGIQVDEGRLASTARGSLFAGDLAADGLASGRNEK